MGAIRDWFLRLLSSVTQVIQGPGVTFKDAAGNTNLTVSTSTTDTPEIQVRNNAQTQMVRLWANNQHFVSDTGEVAVLRATGPTYLATISKTNGNVTLTPLGNLGAGNPWLKILPGAANTGGNIFEIYKDASTLAISLNYLGTLSTLGVTMGGNLSIGLIAFLNNLTARFLTTLSTAGATVEGYGLIIDTTTDNGCKTSLTTSLTREIYGLAYASYGAGSTFLSGAIRGRLAKFYVEATCARGDYLIPSVTNAGQWTPSATQPDYWSARTTAARVGAGLVNGVWENIDRPKLIVTVAAPVRVLNTQYQNTSGKLIYVKATVSMSALVSLDNILQLVADSTASPTTVRDQVAAIGYAATMYMSVSFIVPPNWYYQVNSGGTGTTTLLTWMEETLC